MLARNLTPVTLELGGKSPAIVGPDFPFKTAAERILWVKMLNAGQICTNIDYAFLPQGTEAEFAVHCKRLFAERYPDINGPDYTSIIDDRAFARLQGALEDARAKGATLINLAEGQKPDAKLRKFAPHLVLNPTKDMLLMQREIFGPILPIRTYVDRQEVADYINGHDRPLAIYPFTNDRQLQEFYILARDVGRRLRQRGVAACRTARFTVRRCGRQRDGALPRSGRLHHVLEAAAGILSGALFADPNAVPASLRKARDEAAQSHDQVQDLGAAARRDLHRPRLQLLGEYGLVQNSPETGILRAFFQII